jgi:ribosomal protein S12 methylthiotransferase
MKPVDLKDALPAAMRVGLVSLGCPKNRVDSEVMLGRLAADGHRPIEDLEQADAIIVNTCGFIEDARQESIDTILEISTLKTGKLKKLIVAGCMVNRYATELQHEIPEIDGFVALDELREVTDLVALGTRGALPQGVASQRLFDHRDPRTLTTPGYAYLKVAEGCNNPCTFCAIPAWRGRFRSRPIESLVAEARQLEARGIRELCLIAQDTTRYGEDLGLGRHGLVRLVEALLRQTSVPWIRFLYAYPTTLDDDLLCLMSQEERFCSYLDIPLQHSHADILTAMRRGGSARRYMQILDNARRQVADISLRSTFIVGFPGETEAHFEHLLRFVSEARFDHLGAFAYSPEAGTPGAELDQRVAPGIAEERRERLLAAQEPIALAARRALVGSRLEVLVEGVCDETEHLLQGRHRGMAPEIDGRLLLADGHAAAGELAQVDIVEAYADDLVGHIVSVPPHRRLVAEAP